MRKYLKSLRKLRKALSNRKIYLDGRWVSRKSCKIVYSVDKNGVTWGNYVQKKTVTK